MFEQAETDVDWSYVIPGALLEPGERTGTYRVGGDELLTDEHGRSRITMEDLAVAMLDEVEDPKHSRERFTAAHSPATTAPYRPGWGRELVFTT